MKVSKILILGILVVSAVTFAGCSKEKDVTETKLTNEKEIANVMEAGKSVHCTMTTSEGETIETWNKGKKTKVYGMNVGGSEGKGYMISDGEWVYAWVEGSKEGTKYKVMDEEEMPKYDNGEDFKGEDYDRGMNQEPEDQKANDDKYECSEANISDDTFVPPTGIKFVDVMEEMTKGMESMDLDSFKQK